jgi:hypothetical protein
MVGVAENDLGEKLAARKDRDETLDHTRIFGEVVQKGLVPAFEEAFEINERTFRVSGGGKGGLEMRLDDGEGVAEEGGESVMHKFFRIYSYLKLLLIS